MKKTFFLISAVAMLATGNVYAQTHHGRKKHDRHQETATADSAATAQQQTAQSVKAVLTVQGSCNMCKTRIEKTSKSVTGVTSASWDLKTKKLQISFDGKKTSLDDISKALAKAGHDTEKHRAEDKTYNALPQCCKYRLGIKH
ncbi:MAG: cation transporter [Tannerella sp.]|jgi:Cu(I)/Ag(I) efflux system membrane fusion protein|nr:cation transporter [Tannerella sp.]